MATIVIEIYLMLASFLFNNIASVGDTLLEIIIGGFT